MKTHKFDALSFVAGLIAVVIGVAFLIPADPTDIFDFFNDFGAWFWPVVLVLVGVAIIVPITRHGSPEPNEPEPAPDED